ncbi:MAG: mitochondrial fission ELM1 family protein, partial [Burkholderiales bacterium]
ASNRAPPLRLAAAEACWREGIAEAAERRPAVAWELELVGAGSARRFEYRPAGKVPQVWVLLGRHEGDNRQTLALAEALGWPYEKRRLVFKPGRIPPTWLLGASLLGLNRRCSDELAPPWPDLVLACGRRTAPVARWIRVRSGGNTRLVHLGRPRAPLEAFDLVVTTPQYGLPGRANVLHNVLPLNRAVPQPSEAAVAAWSSRLDSLRRPWIALLVGGTSSSSQLGQADARDLRARAEALVRKRGGSLLIATSPRTPTTAADILLHRSGLPGVCYRWRANDPDNPYALFLARADELIVTGDSASMLAEACATGRPVHYVPLPRPSRRRRIASIVLRLLERRRSRLGERGTPRQQQRFERWFDGLVATGVLRLPRDLGALHQALRWSGLAQPLGTSLPQQPARCDDLERTVTAVRRLLLSGRVASP